MCPPKCRGLASARGPGRSKYCQRKYAWVIFTTPLHLQYVQEVYSFFGVELSIQDANLGLIYQIEGPKSLTRCLPKETHFRIFSMGGHREQVGSITRTWNADNACYSTNIYFNDPNLDVRRKSLFLAAAFLLVSCDTLELSRRNRYQWRCFSSRSTCSSRAGTAVTDPIPAYTQPTLERERELERAIKSIADMFENNLLLTKNLHIYLHDAPVLL